MNKYNMWFNHESPNLCGRLGLARDHYIQNDYKEFRIRYAARIKNFQDYLQGDQEILFLLSNPHDNIDKLYSILDEKYPNRKYHLVVLNDPTYEKGLFYTHWRMVSPHAPKLTIEPTVEPTGKPPKITYFNKIDLFETYAKGLVAASLTPSLTPSLIPLEAAKPVSTGPTGQKQLKN